MSGQMCFVFVHGAWHDHHTWDLVVPLLSEEGYATRALDLPGAGEKAKRPRSFFERPLDAEAFASEPSPNAGVTQEERTRYVVDAVREAAEQTGGRVVLVGHSMGGATVSHVVETVPEMISAAVYVSAFMLPNGMPPVQMIQAPEMADALVPSLFCADPATVGALRIDFGTQDPDYRERIRQAYYGDVDADMVERLLSHLHCDEPAQVVAVPSPVTPGRFGQVPRHYVRCSRDRAVTPAGQDRMIAMVDAEMGNRTVVHELEASHSPFDSRPGELAAILAAVARAD